MIKKFFVILILVGLLTACGGQNSLSIFAPADMFPSDLLANFENETGIRINYQHFDAGENIIARLASGRGRFDLVITNDYIVETAISGDLAKKLDHSRLYNFSNINPLFQGLFFDPDDDFSIPFGVNVHTIVYDPARINISINNYLDLWHPNLRQRLGLPNNYRVINGMALRVMGYSYNTDNPDIIQNAGSFLGMLIPNISVIQNENLEEILVSGEIAAAVLSAPQVIRAKTARPELRLVLPSEGTGFNIMAAFIPSRARNVDAAYTFLNYILDARNGAKCFESSGLFSTFSASNINVSEDMLHFLAALEDSVERGLTEIMKPLNAETQAMFNNVWTEFMSAVR